jgi:DNA-binding NarL/FixJ family response regulator
MSERAITILLVDSDKRGHESLRLVLQANPEFELLGIYESGKEALAACKSHVPELIITGAKLADMPSHEFCKAISHRYPSVGIVVASYGADIAWIEPMLRLGIRALVNKPFIPEIVLDAIRFATNNPPKAVLSQYLKEKELSQISLLIVDEDTQANENLRKQLESNPEYKLLGIFESGKDALVSIAKLNPKLIIVGSELGDICRDDFIKAIIVLYPRIGIITNASQDPQIMQAIMLLGLRFFINRPLIPHELDNVIRWAKEHPQNGLREHWEREAGLNPKGKRKQKESISLLLIDDETTDYTIRGIVDENPKFNLLGSFQTGKEALAACAEALPEVIVLRVETSDMPEEDFVRAVLNRNPTIGFLKLWYTKSPKSMKEMMKGFMTSMLKTGNAMNLYEYLLFAKNNPPKLDSSEGEG